MILLAPWTTRTFAHELPIELFRAVLERLRGTPPRAAALLEDSAEPLRGWSTGGSWSAKEHIGHLDDLHELDVRRLEDYASGAPLLTAADMTNRRTFEAGHNATPTDVLLERLRRNREELAGRLEALDEGVAARVALHPRLQRPMRAIDWMYFVAEHDDHHLARAREVLRAARDATLGRQL